MKPNKPILVIGDSCRDIFIYCHCDRLCPEAPVPVLDILHQTDNLGMAGNVMRNIRDLDHPCELLCNSNSNLLTKTRYVDFKSNHMFIRIDNKLDVHRIPQDILHGINFGLFGAVVISDYDKGFLLDDDITYIGQHHPLTFLDTKKVLGTWAEPVTFIKINRREFNQSQLFLSKELRSKIITTLGEGGCQYQDTIYPVGNVEVKNLSGAGDSFLAGLVVKYLDTGNMPESLIYANNIATVVVQKKGVSTIKE